MPEPAAAALVAGEAAAAEDGAVAAKTGEAAATADEPDAVDGEEDERPEHAPCHPLDKVWLPTYADDNTQDALHAWCTDTGIVRNQGGEQARPRGFWVGVLHKLQRRLAKESDKTRMAAPLTDAQERLILHELDALDGYYDRWWRTESSQVAEFVRVVHKWRPDISERQVIDTVTRMW